MNVSFPTALNCLLPKTPCCATKTSIHSLRHPKPTFPFSLRRSAKNKNKTSSGRVAAAVEEKQEQNQKLKVVLLVGVSQCMLEMIGLFVREDLEVVAVVVVVQGAHRWDLFGLVWSDSRGPGQVAFQLATPAQASPSSTVSSQPRIAVRRTLSLVLCCGGEA